MTVAFVDHHLDNWHAKVFLGLLRDRGHAVVAYETDPLPGDWCRDNDVPRAAELDEAIDRADGIMLLAPDDIEAHLELALAAIPSGKPLWIDKILATNADEANRIVRAAEFHATPLTAGSSLRHAVELEEALASGGRVEEAFFTGYGAWERYGVHTVAMALRAMGGGVARIASVGTDAMAAVALEWRDGRRATLVVAEGNEANGAFPWRFALRRNGTYAHGQVTRFEAFYERQLDAILEDFESRASHPFEEMLDTARLLERVPQARDAGWVPL